MRKIFIFTILVSFVFGVPTDELFLTTPQILNHRNVSYERHKVVTEDGYILSLIRIPRDDSNGVAVLQHSLSLDSAIFLVSQKRSIAMEVYNAGYEVWLPNFRGLRDSDQHTNPSIKKLDYWNFSFHEIGIYDVPAILSYVANVTKTKLIVINHSLSSTASLVYSSLKPKEAEGNVKVFINLASSAFMNHTRTPLKDFTGLQYNIIKPIMDIFGWGAVFYDHAPYVQLSKEIALILLPNNLMVSVFKIASGFLFGRSGMDYDPEEFPMIVSLGTQAVCSKILNHYAQLIESGRFCMYDYGKDENLRMYNSTTPPDYPLEDITAPTYLVISDSDSISDSWGSNVLYDQLPAAAKLYGKMDIKNVNHADYLIGKDRFVYFSKVLEFIKSIK
ncbi:lipase member K-like [Anthonomus grandis grandis]|uniref:lipase member K-like n=1 Tax=Anthonomus grandis grandis TaxID=2921223 RepID=UPI002166B1E2|nr:lipase member K-like [Anthonomus grandis grandis]